jgi:hypothetical protein
METFDLLSINPAKRWKFEDYDSGDSWIVSGKQIREDGFEVAISNWRDSRLILYSIDRPEMARRASETSSSLSCRTSTEMIFRSGKGFTHSHWKR